MVPQMRPQSRPKKAGAKVYSCKPNQGKGAALKTGIQQALEGGYDFIITLDGDGQHDPQEIPAFLEAYESGQQDLIIGKRDFRKMPTVRRISNTLGTLLFSLGGGAPHPRQPIRLPTGQPVPDGKCCTNRPNPAMSSRWR